MSVAAQHSLNLNDKAVAFAHLPKQWPLTAYQSFVEIYVCICIVFMECFVSDVFHFNFNLEILSIYTVFYCECGVLHLQPLTPSLCVCCHAQQTEQYCGAGLDFVIGACDLSVNAHMVADCSGRRT